MTLFKMSLIPPQNYLVEEILLGCILINPMLFSKLIHNIKIESFFLESHQLIYINLLNIYYKNKLHPIELLYSLSDHNNLQQIGGINKIIELMKQSQTFIYSNHTNIYLNQLIEVINNNYTKRLIVQYGYNIIQLSYNKKMSGYILYNKASHYLNITVDKMPRNYTHNLQDLMRSAIYDIKSNQNKHLKNKPNKNRVIESGFIDLDKLTCGLPFGDLIILAGRPSMGKTSLAINIAYNILKKNKYSICIFSLEMSSKQILNKLLSISSNIPYKNLINSHLYKNKNTWHKIKESCKELLTSNMYIYDKSNVSIDYIEYLSKIWIKDNSYIGIIIIDYLQLIQTENLIHLQRVQQLSYITRKLKMLAQYLNVPIITLSQLNRSIETRVNKEPILSDLKESGCINKYIQLNTKNNCLNIKSIIEYLRRNYSNKNDLLQSLTLESNKISSISIINEYLFTILLQKINIQITHNHKYLSINQWSIVNQLTENSYLTSLQNYNKCIKYKILQYSQVKSCNYKLYNTVYDLSMIYYTNFICNNIILHNSIEQDADIIIMLYDKQDSQNNKLENQKVTDLVISKNRHGPIGSCKLIFSKENTSFKNIHHTYYNVYNM